MLLHSFPATGKYVSVSLGIREHVLEFWRVCDLLPSHKMST
jgi:hypothetical protein